MMALLLLKCATLLVVDHGEVFAQTIWRCSQILRMATTPARLSQVDADTSLHKRNSTPDRDGQAFGTDQEVFWQVNEHCLV